jgi:hypothetical protein
MFRRWYTSDGMDERWRVLLGREQHEPVNDLVID